MEFKHVWREKKTRKKILFHENFELKRRKV